MSDFFTKKQRKFWCDKCRVFVEYNKSSIEFHNKSKNHQRMINADNAYKYGKMKIINHISRTYGGDLDAGVYENNPNFHMLKQKTQRCNSNSGGFGGESSILLEEIKRDKMHEQIKEKYKIYKNTEKVWGIFWDNNYNLPYYFNFITQQSQWEKPEDYDGPDIEGPLDPSTVTKHDDTRRLKTEDTNPRDLEGVIGKWEIVNEKSSVLGKKSSDEDNKQMINLPGVITFEQFSKYDPEDAINNEDKGNENEIVNSTKRTKMDDLLCSNSEIHELGKEDLIEFNKKLQTKDYDMRYMTQVYSQDKNMMNQCKLILEKTSRENVNNYSNIQTQTKYENIEIKKEKEGEKIMLGSSSKEIKKSAEEQGDDKHPISACEGKPEEENLHINEKAQPIMFSLTAKTLKANHKPIITNIYDDE